MIVALCAVMLICSLIPAALFLRNLRLYREPPVSAGPLPGVSILIPARNEATGIEAAVRAALRSDTVEFEIVVMDDSSTDHTAAIVAALAAEDPRVRLAQAPALPAGWNGKQHACWALAQTARYPVLCFVDADVRLAPACVARMAAFLQAGSNGLVSGFPRQVTGTWLEWMLLPLIHFVLLGFLPLGRMRAGTQPGFAAGCGQFLMCRSDAYFASGGHSGIKLTMHDGLRLPRLFREHGSSTDLADLTQLATCRMYTSAAQVWSGLAKNATEGLGAPSRIVPLSLLLFLGQMLPFLTILFIPSLFVDQALDYYQKPRPVNYADASLLWFFLACCLLSITAAWLPRILAARRFRQSWRSALLHPLGILLLLAVQWYALIRKLTGRAVSWRDRAYTDA